ncbi:MAG: phosphoribosylformylglycinamidine synthase subunit PurQ [Fimbriimonadaceae bacterium]|nr:phosphoribosylformylglycinamidine synthase subunit PurQ [Fimbriimonadaceae bacterium]
MRVAVIQFPGSNCDRDALLSLRDDLGCDSFYVWHAEKSLGDVDAVWVPGGFSYGDYLRCGAIAANAAIMSDVRRFADEGGPVIGVCNGFQVLCESGLLPGALLLNEAERFVCREVWLKPETRTGPWMANQSDLVELPVAHGEGRYICEANALQQLEENGQVAFRYVDAAGSPTQAANPNGSVNNIAGVINSAGNVLGMMPHPERATRAVLSRTDGRKVLEFLSGVRTG